MVNVPRAELAIRSEVCSRVFPSARHMTDDYIDESGAWRSCENEDFDGLLAVRR